MTFSCHFWTSKGCTTTPGEIQISFFSYISNNFIIGRAQWETKPEPKNLDIYAKRAKEVKNGLSFDLALIDMTMPEMAGVALLETIKTNSPATECIMVTAINEARIAVECLNKGAYDYLVKPVATEDLSLSIKRTLERKRQSVSCR